MQLNRALEEDCDWVGFSSKLVIQQAHACSIELHMKHPPLLKIIKLTL